MTGDKQDAEGTMYMRKAILGTAIALALTSPAMAADLTVNSHSEIQNSEVRSEVRRSEVRSYEREASYGYRTAPSVVVEERAPVVSDTVVVRRPVVVAPVPVVVDEYPVYAAPRVYAYGGPAWRDGWGYRRHFHRGW
jgi:hypothetical protein